jgi:catalase-peroxidase
MAMNDEETVALTCGGHTFGKTHGAGSATHVGAEPEAAPRSSRAWVGRSSFGSGKGGDAITSGLEVMDHNAGEVEQYFFENLFKYEWELTKSPAGAHQWTAKRATDSNDSRLRTILEEGADHHDHRPGAALRSGVRKNLARFLQNPDQFADAFARAWFKLTHRDMGPRARYLGPEVPAEELLWQDPIPAVITP